MQERLKSYRFLTGAEFAMVYEVALQREEDPHEKGRDVAGVQDLRLGRGVLDVIVDGKI